MEFRSFTKIARLSRDIVVTEKIDGTNASILITPDGAFYTGSRTRWIQPEDDNYGFSQWCWDHKQELLGLGVGHHFGEWWGKGINRNYGLKEKRFSLFNTHRWCLYGKEPKEYPTSDPRVVKVQELLPECCGLVPVLYQGPFETDAVEHCLEELERLGSVASPGFMKPEGVVVFHTAGNVMFKKTIDKDDEWKGKK